MFPFVCTKDPDEAISFVLGASDGHDNERSVLGAKVGVTMNAPEIVSCE